MSAGVDPPMAMRNRVLKKRNGEWKLSGNKIFGIEYLDESEFDKPANRSPARIPGGTDNSPG